MCTESVIGDKVVRHCILAIGNAGRRVKVDNHCANLCTNRALLHAPATWTSMQQAFIPLILASFHPQELHSCDRTPTPPGLSPLRQGDGEMRFVPVAGAMGNVFVPHCHFLSLRCPPIAYLISNQVQTRARYSKECRVSAAPLSVCQHLLAYLVWLHRSGAIVLHAIRAQALLCSHFVPPSSSRVCVASLCSLNYHAPHSFYTHHTRIEMVKRRPPDGLAFPFFIITQLIHFSHTHSSTLSNTLLPLWNTQAPSSLSK